MAYKGFLTVVMLCGGCVIHAQPRHVHIIKALPLPLFNPIQPTIQLGYEYHYNPYNSVHVETGYFHNGLIYTELHLREMQGLKVRAERRFYNGGTRDLWNHITYFAPHLMYQTGWLNYEEEFARHGGSYFETMRVKGTFKEFGLGGTYGSYFDLFGTFVVDGSVQFGLKAFILRTSMPEDIPADFFPFPWRNESLDTWHVRPMINLTLGLGLGWGDKYED